MSKFAKESKQGCIISNSVESFKNIRNGNVDKYIAFVMKDKSILKGQIRISGKINDNEYVYGIELNVTYLFLVDEDLKQKYKWNYNNFILVKQDIDFVEVDKEIGSVTSSLINEVPGEFVENELVLAKIKNKYKSARIKTSGTINGIFCYKITLLRKYCEKVNYTVIENDILKMLNERGLIIAQNILELQEEDVVTIKVGKNFIYGDWEGKLKWKGTVNGCPCVGLENDDDDITDFSKFVNQGGLFCILIPLELDKIPREKTNIVKENDEKIHTSINKEKSYNTASQERMDKSWYEDIYKYPLPRISKDEGYKITGNEDTYSTFVVIKSMFLFSNIFEKYLLGDNDFCKYLASKIVFTMRGNKRCDNWDGLVKGFKDNSDSDIFEDLIYKIEFNFKMFNIERKEEDTAPFISLSSATIGKNSIQKIKLIEWLSYQCIKKGNLIYNPPKCFIIVLPSNRIKVTIPSKLDITKLTVKCMNCCSVCSSEADFLCLCCSEEQMDVIYFCKDHKIHCKHEKTDVFKGKIEKIEGKTELDLVAVICKNKFYDRAYIKTLDIKDGGSYLNISDKGDIIHRSSNWEDDIDNLGEDVSVCIYKYAPLEYYYDDF